MMACLELVVAEYRNSILLGVPVRTAPSVWFGRTAKADDWAVKCGSGRKLDDDATVSVI